MRDTLMWVMMSDEINAILDSLTLYDLGTHL